MARQGPQAAGHETALVPRILLEFRKLMIADRLKEESHRKKGDPGPGERPGGAVAADLADLHGQRHEPRNDALQTKNMEETPAGEGCVRTLLPAHRLVPVVLAMADIAPSQVKRQPQRPGRNKGDEEQRSRIGAVGADIGEQGGQRASRTPRDIDNAGVLEARA